jgi:hypothetical protein
MSKGEMMNLSIEEGGVGVDSREGRKSLLAQRDFPSLPLSYRLAWKLLGWGFGRQDGFWITDAYLSLEPVAWQGRRPKV